SATAAGNAAATIADDSSDEHAACEPSATALAAIESGAVATDVAAAVHSEPEATESSGAAEVFAIEAQASGDADAVTDEAPVFADAASFEHREEACDVVDTHVIVTTVETLDTAPSAEAACMAVFAEPVDSSEFEAPALAAASHVTADATEARVAESDDDGIESVAIEEVCEASVDALEVDAMEADAMEADAMEADSSDDAATEDEDESSPSDDGNGVEAAEADASDESVAEYLFEPSDEYLQTDGGEDIASANTEIAPRKRKKKSVASELIDDAYASRTLFDGISEDRWMDTRDPHASTTGDDSAE
ncbi:MAG: hypothetical protein ACO3QC_03925, partial [Phycisphaerales bacterium]